METNLSHLSRREVEILRYIKNGFSSKEIAKTLELSSHTVDTHRRNMLKKMKARNSVEMVLFGVRSGII